MRERFSALCPYIQEFEALLDAPQWTLDKAALLVGKLEDPNLDVSFYVHKLDRLAAEFNRRTPSKRNADAVVERLVAFLSQENGFCGDEKDYFSPENSYLHRVIDRRKGIPLTLSVIYMEIARRVGLQMHGIGMPGHFLIQPAGKDNFFLDPFYKGESLTETECDRRFRAIYGERAYFDKRFLRPLDKHQIVSRLINNLKGIFVRKGDARKTIELIDLYLTLNPNATHELFERGSLYRQLECFNPALRDLEGYLQSLSGDDSNVEERQKVLMEIAALKRLTSNFH